MEPNGFDKQRQRKCSMGYGDTNAQIDGNEKPKGGMGYLTANTPAIRAHPHKRATG